MFGIVNTHNKTAKGTKRFTRRSAQGKRTVRRPMGRGSAAPSAKAATYLDCIAGRVAAPEDALGKLVFQILMVGGMVTFMATFNGVRHSGLSFFTTHHWVYPVVACMALIVRTQIANPIVGFLVPRVVEGRLQGVRAAFATTAINVVTMAPFMTLLTTLLLYGTNDFLFHAADTLPYALGLAFFVNHFIVGPVVRLVYARVLSTARGARLLQQFETDALPWAYIFNS